MPSSQRYQKVSSDELLERPTSPGSASEKDAFLDSLPSDAPGMLPSRQRRQTGRNTYRGIIILGSLNLILLVAILGVLLFAHDLPLLRQSGPYTTNKNRVIKEESYYSPFLDRLDVPLKTVQVKGFLVDLEDPPSIWRQDPSPEVDEAWDRISHFEYLMITADDVRRLGKNPAYAVKAPESFGQGHDAYVGRTEVSHQLHCLNVLRKASYPDYYPKERDGDPATVPLWRPHMTHCLHILLQHLMCTASMDVVTYNWMEKQYYPAPDFSINRQCRDFDAILEWQEANKIPGGFDKMVQHLKELPEDLARVPLPQRYQDLFNETTSGSGSINTNL